MSFLWRNTTGEYYFCQMATPPGKIQPDPSDREKTSGYPSLSGSLTVEAALLLPMFLLTIYLFWGLFTACSAHIRLQTAMDEVTGELAKQSYLLDIVSGEEAAGLSGGEALLARGLGSLAWKAFAKAELVRAVGKKALKASPVKGGASGLSLSKSRWNRKGDIRLVVRYKLVFPGLAGRFLKLSVEQESRRKCWTGKDPPGNAGGDGDAAGEMVYVTDTGRVYHRDINCYHLNITIRSVSLGGALSARNRNGGRYTPCEHCAVSSQSTGTVYITPEGDRYHVVRDCSGLKRTVHRVPLAGAGLPACSHCGAAGGDE